MLPPVATSSHPWQSGYDIRTVQELLGHADAATTMIYTHVLKVGGGGVQSPLDSLPWAGNRQADRGERPQMAASGRPQRPVHQSVKDCCSAQCGLDRCQRPLLVALQSPRLGSVSGAIF
jgi:hypothetical protein